VKPSPLILVREMRGRDVTVNAVAPGPTATDLFLDDKNEATIARLAGQVPLERLGTPADIAEVVAFLASARALVNRSSAPAAASSDSSYRAVKGPSQTPGL
jgi:NAD(P)-dependent dehydrogenase (short-subunit alcohol dehydrogenase family)